MNNMTRLLESFKIRGVRVWAENGHIRCRAPKGVLVAEDVKVLRILKTEILQALEPLSSAGLIPLRARPEHCRVPLAGLQVQVWKSVAASGNWRAPRFCSLAFRIHGRLDPCALQESIEGVIRRHEALRTRITAVDGQPQQHVDEPSAFTLDIVDLSRFPRAYAETAIMRLAEEFLEEEISWDRGPLFAARLFKLSHDEYALILSLDHMITDGLSNAIIFNEIVALYRDIARRLTPSQRPVPLQFADYAVWQKQVHNDWLRQHEGYWKARLVSAPTTELPFDKPEAKSEIGVGEVTQVLFGLPVSTAVRNLARREKTTSALVMLTAYVATISRWCNQMDVLVILVDSGRSMAELVPMVGWLVNHLHLRIQMTATDTLLDLLHNVTNEFYQAYEHQDFNRVPLLIPECTTDLYFNWLPPTEPQWAIDQPIDPQYKLGIQPFSIKRKVAPFPLGTFLSENTGGIFARVLYRTDIFLGETIQRFCSNFNSTVIELTGMPHARIFPEHSHHF